MDKRQQTKLNKVQGDNLAAMQEVSPEIARDLGYTTPEYGYAHAVDAARRVVELTTEKPQDPDARGMIMDPSTDISEEGRQNIRDGLRRIRGHQEDE